MTRIERIQPSLHKKDRVLVYLTGGRLLRITPEELLRFDLRPGMDLAEDVLEELRRAAARSLTRQQAAEMAGRRMLSQKELSDRLVKKGTDPQEAQETARWLAGLGAVDDAAYAGERNGYDLVRWAKSMNVCSLRQRLHYHGKEIVLGGDAYAHVWETVNLTPCDILKVPHHGSLASTSRKLLEHLRPKTAVVTVAARRPDERPHPYIVSLLKEYVENLYFTDAVDIPGLAEPQFHQAVHLEVE